MAAVRAARDVGARRGAASRGVVDPAPTGSQAACRNPATGSGPASSTNVGKTTPRRDSGRDWRAASA